MEAKDWQREVERLENEIKRLNRRIGQLERHNNIWEGFRFIEIEEAKEAKLWAGVALAYAMPHAQAREELRAELWA
jgi:hypothetical protein